jgi:cytochrome c oxidase cbb3-type subunit 2
MPAYPWLAKAKLDGAEVAQHMLALKRIGDPYTDADLAGAPAAVEGKTELDAVIAYLQGLGTHVSQADMQVAEGAE